MDPSFLRIVAEVHWVIKIKLKAMHWKNGTIEAGRFFHHSLLRSRIAAFQVVPSEAEQSKATKAIRGMQLDWLKIGIISENLQMKKMCFNKVHIHALARLIKNNNNEQKMKAEKKLRQLVFYVLLRRCCFCWIRQFNWVQKASTRNEFIY